MSLLSQLVCTNKTRCLQCPRSLFRDKTFNLPVQNTTTQGFFPIFFHDIVLVKLSKYKVWLHFKTLVNNGLRDIGAS